MKIKKYNADYIVKLVILFMLIIVVIGAFIRGFYYGELSGNSRGTMVGYATQECYRSFLIGIISFICLFVFFIYNSIRGWNKK